MNLRKFLILGGWLIVMTLLNDNAFGGEDRVVRVAKLQIHPDQLENYKAALREEIEASLRIEPGVLALYAVSEKGSPFGIMIFEIYANVQAYKIHLETPHFKKYKAETQKMIESLELVETTPVVVIDKKVKKTESD